jgi:hypothetical protein
MVRRFDDRDCVTYRGMFRGVERTIKFQFGNVVQYFFTRDILSDGRSHILEIFGSLTMFQKHKFVVEMPFINARGHKSSLVVVYATF